MNKLTLPNGLEIFYIDKLTALWVYNEIFVDNIYLKNGIEVNPSDIIFDVGANIGLFSLFIAEKASDLKIYTFEPIKQIYEILIANLSRITCDIKNFNIGLSDTSGTTDIIFYPKVSADSAITPFDLEFKVNKYMEHYKEAVCKDFPMAHIIPHFLRKRVVRAYLKKLYEEEKVPCQLRTLSEIIEEHEIIRIDLLKIDAENHEWHVINGIKEKDWEKIKQITMEVHEHIKNGANLLKKLVELLTSKDFTVKVGKEDISAKLGVYILYAIRKDET
ncbi:MAG: FkbM family methyltransferase [Promethearchaeota archaeon]